MPDTPSDDRIVSKPTIFESLQLLLVASGVGKVSTTAPAEEDPVFRTKVAWMLVIVSVFAWRGRDALAHPQLWAEDGVFLLDAIQEGLRVLFAPYAGYLHLLPRLIAWAATRLNAGWIPAIFVYLAFGFTLVTCWRIFSPRFHLRGKPWMALAIVAIPHSGEVYLTPTNLQWILVFTLLVTLLSDDLKRRVEWLTDVGTVVIVGLTGPFILLLSPLFLVRAMTRRTVASWSIFGSVVLIALLQGWQVWFHSPPPWAGHPRGPLDLYRGWIVVTERIPVAIFSGKLWVDSASSRFVALIGIVFTGLLAWIIWEEKSQRAQRLTLAVFLVTLLVIGVLRNRIDTWPDGATNVADRYLFVPRIVFLWIIANGVGLKSTRGWICSGLIVAAGICAVTVLELDPQPYHEWLSPEQVSSGAPAQLEINPGWKLNLPPREQWR